MYLQLLLIDKNSSNTKMISRSGNHHRKTDNKGLNDEFYKHKHWQSIPALMWTSCSFFTLQIRYT